MKRLICSIISVILVFSLCGCGEKNGVRLTLKPVDYTAAEDVENSAKVFQESALPSMYPMFGDYECIKLGMYIQADMYVKAEGEYKYSAAMLEIAEKNFKSAWVRVCLADDEEVFNSKNIKSAYFDGETEKQTLVFELDAKGKGAFERATLNNQKQKLIIYLDNSTIGEYTLDQWSKDGIFKFCPDAQYSESEQKSLIADIMSCAGLSGKYEVVGKEVL